MTHTLISRQETADRAQVRLRTVARWLSEGKLTRHTDGRGRVWIDPEELEELLKPVAASA